MLYDKDIREPLFYYLEERFGKSRILEELNMGRSRADVVMFFRNALSGWKSKAMPTHMTGWNARSKITTSSVTLIIL